jgi:hypothetical protein
MRLSACGKGESELCDSRLKRTAGRTMAALPSERFLTWKCVRRDLGPEAGTMVGIRSHHATYRIWSKDDKFTGAQPHATCLPLEDDGKQAYP